jgi:hypothetical protein
MKVASPSDYREKFQEMFMGTLKQVPGRPEAILVRPEELADILKPVTSALKIKLKRVKRLDQLDKLVDHLLANLFP